MQTTTTQSATLTLKTQLADALGAERAPRYWRLLQGVVTGKVGAALFAQETRTILVTKHEQTLHNQLILAILKASTNPHPSSPSRTVHAGFTPSGTYTPPASVPRAFAPSVPISLASFSPNANSQHDQNSAYRANSSSSAVHQSANANTSTTTPSADAKKPRPAPYKKPSRLLTAQALDDMTRSTILAVKDRSKKPEVQPPRRFMHDEMLEIPETLTPEIQARLLTLQTCRQSASLPSLDALRSRMQVIGALNGIDIDIESVIYMEQALATYLKDILSSVHERVRTTANQEPNARYASGFATPTAPNTPAACNTPKTTAGAEHGGNGCVSIPNGVEGFLDSNGSAGRMPGVSCSSGVLVSDDLMLSTEITPILIKRCPGAVDILEMLQSVV
ncbi:transcriptional regulator of RNA polII, SAGA, subunit-domain-containing protein [Chytriomyces cf. hyalinus JEL632]|nr:transcriptional regulator of RNA polII, SAGA, subunit-domain-containing protein [Chytriomyces cf. hyalinus JEL632]